MKEYAIWCENAHSNFGQYPFTGNRHKSEREAKTELALLFDSATIQLLKDAGLYFTIDEI